MRIKTKVSLVFSIIIILTVVFGYFTIYQLTTILEKFQKERHITMEEMQKAVITERYAQSTKYYDEVLTHSARNYAFTQDKKWEETHRITESVLDIIIQNAIKKGDADDYIFFTNINNTNVALLKMEHEAIELVNQGHPDDAIKILESKEYWNQKKAYQQELADYVTKHTLNQISTSVIHTNELDDISSDIEDLIKNEINTIFIGITSIVIVSIIMGFVIIRKFQNQY